jgi:hypothetical protein
VSQSLKRTENTFRGRLKAVQYPPVLARLTPLGAATYAGRNHRTGIVSAAIAGASEPSIMNQTGHCSVQMVRRYIRVYLEMM